MLPPEVTSAEVKTPAFNGPPVSGPLAVAGGAGSSHLCVRKDEMLQGLKLKNYGSDRNIPEWHCL